MTKNQAVRDEKNLAVAKLKTYLRPNDTLYTILQSTSRSGMQRKVSVYVILNNKPIRITHLVAHACGYRYDNESGSLVITGAGFDPATEIAYGLSFALYGESATKFTTDTLY